MRSKRRRWVWSIVVLSFAAACSDATLPTEPASAASPAARGPSRNFRMPEVVVKVPKCEGMMCPDAQPGGGGAPGAGGSSSGGGTGGTPKPVELKEPAKPDSCQTGDPAIDSPQVQAGLALIWKNSNYGPNVPMEQRVEDGGWILRNPNGSFTFQRFPASWVRETCSITPPGPVTPPATAVGVVHTHPFRNGEALTACPPLVTRWGTLVTNYNGATSDDDDSAIAALRLMPGFEQLKGYMIDADGIVTYTGPGAAAQQPRVARCGY